MADAGWEELDPHAAGMAPARLTLHLAVQLVAAVGQSLAPRADDDSQQSLGLAPDGTWQGAWVQGGGALRAALDPAGLELQLVAAGAPVARLALAGRTLADGLGFLARELGTRGVAGALALPRHPADFPAHPLARGAAFEAGEPAARRELARLFADTALVLRELAGPGAPPPRLWPHHFDLAGSIAAGERTVGLGVSPGDAAEGLPYWYATPQPAPPQEGLPPLEGGGRWHREGWIGAALPLERLRSGAAAQHEQVAAFFRSVLATARQPLAAPAS